MAMMDYMRLNVECLRKDVKIDLSLITTYSILLSQLGLLWNVAF